MTPAIRIQSEAIDAGAEYTEFVQAGGYEGAVVMFTGRARGRGVAGQPITALVLEHYEGLCMREMTRIAEEAATRFSLVGVRIVHRYGRIQPGETIVVALAAAPHRQAAFDGALFMIDRLKTHAPFWKKEESKTGGGAWVAARQSDTEADMRWEATSKDGA